MPQPVSIIIPLHNRESVIGETLDSVAAQTDGSWECIVVDDHSTDDSFAVAGARAGQDGRFKLMRRRSATRGANVCRNEGASAASGEWLIFLDSDDVLKPDCVARRLAAAREQPEVEMLVWATEMFTVTPGDLGQYWNVFNERDDLERFLDLDTPWQTTGPLWRRESFERLGGWDERLLSFQDWEMHLRALVEGVTHHKVPVADNCWRFTAAGGDALSRKNVKQASHLESHEYMIDAVRQRMERKGLLEGEALRRQVAGLYLWLGKRWVLIGRFGRGTRFWKRALAAGLVSRRVYWEGVAHLLTMGRRGAFRVNRYLRGRWPEEYLRKGSDSFHRATAIV